MTIEIILFYSRSAIRRRPYFDGINCHRKVRDSVTQTKNDARDSEQSDNGIFGEPC